MAVVIAVSLFTNLEISANLSLRDSIVSDFDTLIAIVEDTHPDPYTNYGGRVSFHERANEIRKILRNTEKPSIAQLHELSTGFLAGLQDGHSFMERLDVKNSDSGMDSLVLVKFEYVDSHLVVNAIDKDASHLLGSRLTGISSEPIEKVLERVAAINPCENEAGRYNYMTGYFRSLDTYRKLSGKVSGDVSLELVTPLGENVSYKPKVIYSGDFNSTDKARTPRNGDYPTSHMEWRETDGNMVLRLSSILARENFEYQYNNGWDFYSQLQYYYWNQRIEMPGDTLAAINAIPEFSETFIDMLSEMKSKKIDNLIIDLRGNGGGWTPVIIPSLYMMFGDDYLTTDMESKFYRRLSDLYLKKINTSLERFNAEHNTAYNTGDYIMPDENETSCPIEQKRAEFIRQAFCSERVKDRLKALDGRPLYRPKNIYVVTDGGTFSAAFHYAFYLSKMGAVIAGETSSQAPNCYMEVTPFVLPLTGLTGSVSNSLQAFLPSVDPRARQFTPDVRISYEDYCRLGFDQNAILMHIIESCNDNGK